MIALVSGLLLNLLVKDMEPGPRLVYAPQSYEMMIAAGPLGYQVLRYSILAGSCVAIPPWFAHPPWVVYACTPDDCAPVVMTPEIAPATCERTLKAPGVP